MECFLSGGEFVEGVYGSDSMCLCTCKPRYCVVKCDLIHLMQVIFMVGNKSDLESQVCSVSASPWEEV